MKPIITWIVVTDGDQAKVFEHDGPGKGLRVVKDLVLEQERLRAGEIMADRPGRSMQSAGPGSRSGIAYSTDPVAERERKFVEHLADVRRSNAPPGRSIGWSSRRRRPRSATFALRSPTR